MRHSITVILLFVLSSCSFLDLLKHDESKKEYNDVPQVNEDNFEEFVNVVDKSIENYIDKYQIETASDFEPYLAELKDEEWVEDIEINGNALIIKIENGGYIIYGDSGMAQDVEDSRSDNNSIQSAVKSVKSQIDSTLDKLDNIKHAYFGMKSLNYDDQSFADNDNDLLDNINRNHQSVQRSTAESDFLYGCENKRVLIANVTEGEIFLQRTADELHEINNLLCNYYGLFEVDYKRGSEVTVEFLRDHLTEYGLIFLVSHGCMSKKYCCTFVKTGSRAFLAGENKSDYEDWKENNFSLIRYIGKDDVYYWCVSPHFFNHIEGSFAKNSIMVTVICDALTPVYNMGDVLLDKGLGAFIGFKGITRVPYASDAFNSFVNMFPRSDRPNIIGLQQSFKEFNGSPYKYESKIWNKQKLEYEIETRIVDMILKSKEDNISLFSTVSEAKEVNLGLPWNWASANLGAENPSESGDFHIIGKCESPKEIKIGNICGKIDADIVTQSMGKDWQLPPAAFYAWITPDLVKWDYNFVYKGKRGARLTGPSGESIFLPYYGRYEVNSMHNDHYPDRPYDNNYSTALPYGQIEWFEKDEGAHIYIFSPSRFRNNMECGGIRTEVGEYRSNINEERNYSYNFHSCLMNVRGVRPNVYYEDKYRSDYDVSDIQKWKSIFR